MVRRKVTALDDGVRAFLADHPPSCARINLRLALNELGEGAVWESLKWLQAESDAAPREVRALTHDLAPPDTRPPRGGPDSPAARHSRARDHPHLRSHGTGRAVPRPASRPPHPRAQGRPRHTSVKVAPRTGRCGTGGWCGTGLSRSTSRP